MVLLVIQLALLVACLVAMYVLGLVWLVLMMGQAGDGTPSPTDWLIRVGIVLIATAIVVLLFAALYIGWAIVGPAYESMPSIAR